MHTCLIVLCLVGEKIIRYNGERCAQMDRTKGVREPPNDSRPWWFPILNWVLFLTPEAHAKRLGDILIDHQVNYQYWGKFSRELQEDWLACIIPVGCSSRCHAQERRVATDPFNRLRLSLRRM